MCKKQMILLWHSYKSPRGSCMFYLTMLYELFSKCLVMEATISDRKPENSPDKKEINVDPITGDCHWS